MSFPRPGVRSSHLRDRLPSLRRLIETVAAIDAPGTTKAARASARAAQADFFFGVSEPASREANLKARKSES